jgi:hypothetical protein
MVQLYHSHENVEAVLLREQHKLRLASIRKNNFGVRTLAAESA